MKNQTPALNDVSTSFVAQHFKEITGVLQAWDRLRFMGNISLLQRPAGVMMWFFQLGVLLKNFKKWSEALTDRLREHGIRRWMVGMVGKLILKWGAFGEHALPVGTHPGPAAGTRSLERGSPAGVPPLIYGVEKWKMAQDRGAKLRAAPHSSTSPRTQR